MNANEHQALALDDPRFALVDGMTRPDFMLVGGMKCGTTSFARYLSAHPQVDLAGPKEPNYWSWHRYPARYQNFFVNESPLGDPGADQRVSGEFSTSYLVHPLAPRRVRANLPDLKVFVLLRNPADRAYSHFVMSKRAGLENECSFEEIVRREIDEAPELLAAHERGFVCPIGAPNSCYSAVGGAPLLVAEHRRGLPARKLRDEVDLRDFYYRSYVFRSIYHDQLHRWMRLYPRKQLMIVQSEKFFANSACTMRAAAHFLGLRPFDFDNAKQLRRRWDAGAGNARQLPQDYPAMSDRARALLVDFFASHNERLYRLTGENYGWS